MTTTQAVQVSFVFLMALLVFLIGMSGDKILPTDKQKHDRMILRSWSDHEMVILVIAIILIVAATPSALAIIQILKQIK